MLIEKALLKRKISNNIWESVFSGGVRKGQNIPLKKSRYKNLSWISSIDINEKHVDKSSRNLNKRSQRDFFKRKGKSFLLEIYLLIKFIYCYLWKLASKLRNI